MYVTGGKIVKAETAYEEEMKMTPRKVWKMARKYRAYHTHIKVFKTRRRFLRTCTHEIGVKLCKKENVGKNTPSNEIATHFNTGTYHNHFVFMFINMFTSKKFNCQQRVHIIMFRILSR